MTAAAHITLYRPDYASVRLIECSPPSWMVEIALHEKGLDFRVRELSFARGEHKTAAMLARNPRGTIPVLEHGAACLWETLAILEHLDDAYPEPPLLGRSAEERGRARNRLHESGAVKNRGMSLLAYLMRTPEAERDATRIAAERDELVRELGHWQGYYSATTWSAGESMTLADVSLFSYLATFAWLGLEFGEMPALERFYQRMSERPSVRATWPKTWSSRAGFDRPRPLAASDHG